MALFPQISYPGVLYPKSCSYTVSHGISPGTATLVCVEQPILPAENGDLLIGDGETRILIPGMRVDNIKFSNGGDGERLWTIALKDRRWKWLYSFISLAANQTIDAGFGSGSKLIPWTIRSPVEMAALCLEAMGESGYLINLPIGLTSAWGANLTNYLQAGQNFPLTGVNPPIDWQFLPPAFALQQLCDFFGAHIVYDVINDRVLVTPIGVGGPLPDGFIRQTGPGLKTVPMPDGAAIIGGRTKYQARFLMEPVGIEWNQEILPIDQLSYAPVLPGTTGTVQISRIKIRAGNDPLFATVQWRIILNGSNADYESNGGDDLDSVVAALVAKLDLISTQLGGIVNVASEDHDIILTGLNVGAAFQVGGVILHTTFTDNATIEIALDQPAVPAVPGRRGWDYSTPPTFADVVSTDRLTYAEAKRLAQSCVFKMYRVRNVGLNGQGPIFIPGYGNLVRRQQAYLTDELCELIEPQETNQSFFRRNQDLDPHAPAGANDTEFIENLYQGFARSKPAAAYGTYEESLGDVDYFDASEGGGTPGDQKIFVPFSVDPIQQTITFDRPIYRFNGDDKIAAGKVTLETGVYIRNAATNQFEAFTMSRRLRTDTTTNFFETQVHEDVQLSVIGKYRFIRSGTLPGSGQVEIVQVKFANGANPAQPLEPFAENGHTWKITVGGIEYTHNSSISDTPVDVANAFSLIPSPIVIGGVPQINVALVSALPPAWSSITAYVPGKPVMENGYCYVCVIANTNSQPTLPTPGVPPNPNWRRVTPPLPTITFMGITNGFAFDVDVETPPPPDPSKPSYQPFVMRKTITQIPIVDQDDFLSQPIGATILESDPFYRADYYLRGLIAKYVGIKLAQTIDYNTVMPISCDGAVSQVSWEVGDGKPVRTTASLNCEHSDLVLPYPARRRAELLPAVMRGNAELGREE